MALFTGWRRRLLQVSLTGAWLALSFVAHADKVHLRSGSVLEGKVKREGDKIVVLLESGSIRLDADSVLRIEKAVTPLEEITQLRAKLADDAISERIELANRCREAELARCERQLLEEVIARDANHAEARARLGYVRVEDGWIKRAELTARNEEREKVARAADQRALAQAQIERDTAELSRKQAELALERERLALQKAEIERKSSESARVFGYFPYSGQYTLKPPALQAPHNANYTINGVRMPSDPRAMDMPGVRSPQSYFH
jgi:hypothetical protein